MEQVQDISVRENSGNAGAHRVRGAATRRRYGRKKHGQVFPMDPRDQRAQPHLYIVVGDGAAMQAMPVRPSAPAVSMPVNRVVQPPPAPVPQPVVSVAEPNDNGPAEPQPGFNVDDTGIDISILPLPMIRRLDLDEESAAEAYMAEMDGKNRKTVLAYLEKQAGDMLEFEE